MHDGTAPFYVLCYVIDLELFRILLADTSTVFYVN